MNISSVRAEVNWITGSEKCQPDSIPWQYDAVGEKCYFLDSSSRPLSRDEAVQRCGKIGAHLPYVKTNWDQIAIAGMKDTVFWVFFMFLCFFHCPHRNETDRYDILELSFVKICSLLVNYQ